MHQKPAFSGHQIQEMAHQALGEEMMVCSDG
jgi:hypothetical protein